MYDSKKTYKYGSIEESIAIYFVNKERNEKILKALLDVAPPENRDKLYRQYKGILFPEDRYDDLAHMKKMQGMMKKLRGTTISVMPIQKPKGR